MRRRTIFSQSINPMFLKTQFCLCLFLAAWVSAKGSESERIYSVEEVAIIDRENKLWRLVDATKTVDANIQRLLDAGFPSAEVEAIRPRLAAMWEIDLGLRLDWLDQATMDKVKELEPEYTIKLRRARVRAEIFRLGGENEPLTPGQIRDQWRNAIVEIMDEYEREQFALLNSHQANTLAKFAKDVNLTTAELKILCEWQLDYTGTIQMINRQTRLSSRDMAVNAARRKEALLDHWQRMRGLLGDDRFATYLRAADIGFGRMVEVLRRISGVGNGQYLDLWWLRKKDEIAEVQMIWGSARSQLKIKNHEAALAVLGMEKLKIYEQFSDAKWLERNNPYQAGKVGIVALKSGD